jgi:aromatic ring-cleaving dioxygenase
MSSAATFAAPVTSFDVHIYFFQGNERSVQSAARLRDDIIQTFPDLDVYKLHTTPIGAFLMT